MPRPLACTTASQALSSGPVEHVPSPLPPSSHRPLVQALVSGVTPEPADEHVAGSQVPKLADAHSWFVVHANVASPEQRVPPNSVQLPRLKFVQSVFEPHACSGSREQLWIPAQSASP